MTADMLRVLDRLVGQPLCWLLTVLRYATRPFLRRKSRSSPTRVLVIRLSEMGTTVLAAPAVIALRDKQVHCDPWLGYGGGNTDGGAGRGQERTKRR
mgnify:CR=1 FL=1